VDFWRDFEKRFGICISKIVISTCWMLKNQWVIPLWELLVKWKAQMALVGYARVSTKDQDLSALKAAGVEVIYREKVSGTRADRIRTTPRRTDRTW
jgi:hypothetical protein